MHQAHMGDRFTPLDPVYADTAQALAQQLGDPAAAQGLLYALLQKQAAMLSFIDDFHFLGFCILAIIPLLLLMGRVRPGAAMEMGH
jgi:MFS transporter, DHA2 family, multidrug resistance protein